MDDKIIDVPFHAFAIIKSALAYPDDQHLKFGRMTLDLFIPFAEPHHRKLAEELRDRIEDFFEVEGDAPKAEAVKAKIMKAYMRLDHTFDSNINNSL